LKKLKKITTKALTVSALSLMLVSQSNAQTSIEACQTLPKAMESNISSWKNISAKGNSIIDQIDKLASNVNGILKIEADLKRMDKQLGDAKKLFDTFVPIVTPVSSVKNVFKLASDTFGNIRTKGVSPAKDTATKIATQSGIRELQKQLDQNVKPKIQTTIDIANKNAAEVTAKLNSVNSSCKKLAATSCVLNQSFEQISNATKAASSLVNKATSAQNFYLGNESRLNDGLVKANNALAFSGDLSKQIGDIKKPISDIAGSVNKVGSLLDKKITIKVASFKKSFKLKDAFKKVGKIVKDIKKIPGVKNVEKQVNKPIEAVMNEVTKPISTALKPLKKGLKVPSVSLSSLDVGKLPDVNPDGPNGLPNLASLDPVLRSLMNACK